MTDARNLSFFHMKNKSWKYSKLNGWNHLPRKRVSGWELELNKLNEWNSDRWRTRSDNVVSTKSKGNEEKGASFYRWSARKTKRHFDPRYEPFDEWHMSCALNASAACQTSVALTASDSINHRPKVLVTVSYKVQNVTVLIVSSSTQYLQSSS